MAVLVGRVKGRRNGIGRQFSEVERKKAREGEKGGKGEFMKRGFTRYELDWTLIWIVFNVDGHSFGYFLR